MYPFFGSDKTRKIFGTDLYEDKSLKGLLFELVDEEKVKPFECVGTRAEIKVALYLSLKINGKKELPYLLSVAKREILEKQKSMQIRAKKMLSEWGPHNLSKEFEKLLKTYV